MSLSSEFVADPTAFLGQYIVVVQDGGEAEPKKDPVEFFLRRAGDPQKTPNNNYVFLVRRAAMHKVVEDPFLAYWLPWKKGKTTTLTLGTGAKFMFTSEMTNCRFSVLTSDMAKPLVGHGDGTVESKLRDEFEAKAGFPTREEDVDKKMRRMSRSGANAHHYVGNKGGTSSAFVFGHCKDTTWKFYAQVVKGVMAGDTQDSLKVATEKVVPLDQAYEIA
jgi:hypothetical protein